MEDLFIEIEVLLGEAGTMKELKEIKMEYFRNHRLTMKYMEDIQRDIEDLGGHG